MIEAKSRAYVQIPNTPHILDERRLCASTIRALKLKVRGNVPVEDPGPVDAVRHDMEAQIFVNRSESTLDAGLQFVSAIVCGHATAHIGFAKAPVLSGCDWRR